MSCGCDTAKFTGEFDASVCGQVGVTKETLVNSGKRDVSYAMVTIECEITQ